MVEFVRNKRGHLEAVCTGFLDKFELDEEVVILKTYDRDAGLLTNLGLVKLEDAKRRFGNNWIRLAYKNNNDDGLCTVIVELKGKKGSYYARRKKTIEY